MRRDRGLCLLHLLQAVQLATVCVLAGATAHPTDTVSTCEQCRVSVCLFFTHRLYDICRLLNIEDEPCPRGGCATTNNAAYYDAGQLVAWGGDEEASSYSVWHRREYEPWSACPGAISTAALASTPNVPGVPLSHACPVSTRYLKVERSGSDVTRFAFALREVEVYSPALPPSCPSTLAQPRPLRPGSVYRLKQTNGYLGNPSVGSVGRARFECHNPPNYAPKGCAAAVNAADSSAPSSAVGMPNSALCAGKSKPQDEFLTYPWYAACCEWQRFQCVPKGAAHTTVKGDVPYYALLQGSKGCASKYTCVEGMLFLSTMVSYDGDASDLCDENLVDALCDKTPGCAGFDRDAQASCYKLRAAGKLETYANSRACLKAPSAQIRTAKECGLAATSLGYGIDDGFSSNGEVRKGSWATLPTGCSVWAVGSGHHTHFNTYERGAANDDMSPICKRCARL